VSSSEDQTPAPRGPAFVHGGVSCNNLNLGELQGLADG